jgi:hypothetical protein
MTAPVYLAESPPRDCRAILHDLQNGTASLAALCADFTPAHLREPHLIGAERSLVALQCLLVKLRAHVPADGAH